MVEESSYLESLIGEYEELFQPCAPSESMLVEENLRSIVDTLCMGADWTERGADKIIQLATDYGAFMLRNALAIAVVLGMEDGKMGL
jgi:hypothetical protein